METKRNQTGEHPESNSQTLKGILQSILDYIVSIIKLPFKAFAKFFTQEIAKAIRKDIKTYVMLSFLFFCMLIIGSIIWLFLAISIGVYFHENGSSLLESIGYSVLIQTVCFLLIGLILYFTSKKLRSLQLIKTIWALKDDL